jgi:hypothetical protein
MLALADRGDCRGGVVDRVQWEVVRVGPGEFGVFARFAVGWVSAPLAWLEEETESGVAVKVAAVDGQDHFQVFGVERDPGFFASFADGCVRDALALFKMAGGGSARVRGILYAY